jgi:hypothetical protein
MRTSEPTALGTKVSAKPSFLESPEPADAVAAARDRIDAALKEMRDFLTDEHPTTDAEALQSLRHAFPSVPLAERIAAIRTRFFI